MSNKNGFKILILSLFILLLIFIFLHNNMIVIKFKIFNLLNKKKVPNCALDLSFDDSNKIFFPNQTIEFTGCNIYLEPTLVKINKYGYRGENFEIKKDNSTLRILTLGDSFTFGWGLNEDQTYPYYLQEILKNKCSKDIEVINLGIPGFNAEDEKDLMLNFGYRLSPDYVLITFLGDDWATEENWIIHDSYYQNISDQECDERCEYYTDMSSFFSAQNFMRINRFNLTFNIVNDSYTTIDDLSKDLGFKILLGNYGIEKKWEKVIYNDYNSLGWEFLDFSDLRQVKYFLNIRDTHPNEKATKEMAIRYAKKISKQC